MVLSLCGWKQFVILWGYVSNTGTYLSIYGTHFISCYCILVKSPVCSPLPSIIMSNRHRHKITYKIFSIYSPIIENVRKREPLSVHNYKPQFDSTNKQRNMDPDDAFCNYCNCIYGVFVSKATSTENACTSYFSWSTTSRVARVK